MAYKYVHAHHDLHSDYQKTNPPTAVCDTVTDTIATVVELGKEHNYVMLSIACVTRTKSNNHVLLQPTSCSADQQDACMPLNRATTDIQEMRDT